MMKRNYSAPTTTVVSTKIECTILAGSNNIDGNGENGGNSENMGEDTPNGDPDAKFFGNDAGSFWED